MADNTKRWYVLRVVGGKERKIKEYIEKEIANLGLTDFVSQVLIPTEKAFQIRNGKKIAVERNILPGYVMVEANLVGEIPHILRGMTNVMGFLGDTKGGDPVPMRQREVDRILGKVDELAEQAEECHSLLAVLHQPLISRLVLHLSGVVQPMSTASVAVLEGETLDRESCELICVL